MISDSFFGEEVLGKMWVKYKRPESTHSGRPMRRPATGAFSLLINLIL